METSFLAYVRGRCRGLTDHGVTIGIGDDAAVVRLGDGSVLCVDQIVDGVDFRWRDEIGGDVGFKSVAINVSDLAAMGATPRHLLVTLTLPSQRATEVAGLVYEGIIEAARRYDLAIVGGDISTHDGGLAITVTAVGELTDDQPPWRRGGGDEDQVLFVTGPVGGSILGRHLRPEPRVDVARRLRDIVTVTAAIDVSDGLSLDLDRMLAASGVGVLLDVEAIPIHHDAVRLSEQSGQTPFRHAWSDGEDFELLFLTSESDARVVESHDWAADGLPRPVRIGVTTSRMGMWKNQDGRHERLSPQGYVHDGNAG